MGKRYREAKAVDIVWYLAEHGYHPVRESSTSASYLSPFRTEGGPSFFVDKKSNRWADYGKMHSEHDRAFGDITDLVGALENCSSWEAADKILGGDGIKKYSKPDIDAFDKIKNIDIVEERDKITNETLIGYLELHRKIPVEVANKYCSQVLFQFASSRHTSHWGVGLKNDKGGYSLRNTWFKGNTRPAGICTVTFDDMSLEVNLFEGLFDFLSYTILKEPPYNTCIVLNSLVFIPFLTDHLRIYDTINLYLDNDGPADDKIEYMFAQGLSPIDKRGWYSDYNDINDKLMAEYDI